MKSRFRVKKFLEGLIAFAFAGAINSIIFGTLALYTRSGAVSKEPFRPQYSYLQIKRIVRREENKLREPQEGQEERAFREESEPLPIQAFQKKLDEFDIAITPIPLPDLGQSERLELADIPEEISFLIEPSTAVKATARRRGSLSKARSAQGSITRAKGMYSLGEVDKGPVRVYTPRPPYPESARRRGLTGRVVVVFTVDESGRVVNPYVESSRGGAIFEQAVLSTLKTWRFEPAKKNGRPVVVRCRIAFNFKLKEP